MRFHQLLLFPRSEVPAPPPGPLRHRWIWHSIWPSECARCFALWPAGVPAGDVLRQVCPGPALDMGFNDYRDVELVWLG